MKNPLTKLKGDDALEGYDKFVFLRWLQEESIISGISDEEKNKICLQWIRYRDKHRAEYESERNKGE